MSSEHYVGCVYIGRESKSSFFCWDFEKVLMPVLLFGCFLTSLKFSAGGCFGQVLYVYPKLGF